MSSRLTTNLPKKTGTTVGCAWGLGAWTDYTRRDPRSVGTGSRLKRRMTVMATTHTPIVIADHVKPRARAASAPGALTITATFSEPSPKYFVVGRVAACQQTMTSNVTRTSSSQSSNWNHCRLCLGAGGITRPGRSCKHALLNINQDSTEGVRIRLLPESPERRERECSR
jgi:hypothetical protein